MCHHIKYLVLLLIMLLGLYPIAELTRVIVVSGTYYFPDMDGQFIAEIVLMWLLYLSIIPVFLLVNNYHTRHLKDVEAPPKASGVSSSKDSFPLTGEEFIRVDYKFRLR